MMPHAPVFVFLLPLVGAVLAMLAGLRFERAGWYVAAAIVVALALLARVAAGGSVDYVAGGFAVPFGIELVVDGLSAPLLVVIAVVFAAVVAYAHRAGPHATAFYSLLCLLVTGLTGMTVTGDAFNLYVFLEIAGLAAYALVASGDDADAAVAAFKYLLVGTVGASLYLLGVGFLLIATGTLNMADLAARIAEIGYDSPLVVVAFGLIAGGLAVKTALFPVHTWQPDAYATAPDSVATVISALMSTVAAYAIGRMVLSVFTVDFFVAVPLARDVVLALAAISIVAGSVLAVLQTEVRRILAYSSVSQFGMIVAGFVIATPLAVVGALIHLIGHAIMKGGLFATAGLVSRRTGAETLADYDGLNQRDRLGAGAFAVLALAMVGVPPAVGFVGKWYIVIGAVEAESWSIAAVLLGSTVLTLAYFASIVERMYFREPAAGPGEQAQAPSPAQSSGQGATVDVADGGDPTTAPDGNGRPPVSLGMIAVVVDATVAAVALGFGASQLQPLVEDTLQGVLA
jgi:multicomponent Na+:H+ antiporter subunit D